MSTRCFDLSNLAVTSSSLPLPKMARSNAVACQSCGTGRASCTPSSVRRFPWFGMNAKNTTHHSAQYRSLCTVTAERRPLEPRVRKAEWPPRVGKIFAWANSEINANSLVATSQLNSTQRRQAQMPWGGRIFFDRACGKDLRQRASTTHPITLFEQLR